MSGSAWNVDSRFLRALIDGTITHSLSAHCGCGCEERGEPCEGQEPAGTPTESLSAPATAPDGTGEG